MTKELKGTGVAAHHVSQDAAYGGVIPKNEGLTLPMPGDAITDVGSAHYDAHASMEAFWNQFIEGGAREGEIPTNAEYLETTQKSLEDAGVPFKTAKQATEDATAQQQQYGLQPADSVPRVPGKMNQAKPTDQPNAPIVPAGKTSEAASQNMIFKPATVATLEQLKKSDWFARVGENLIDSGKITIPTTIVSSWDEAINHCQADEWSWILNESANIFRARLAKTSQKELNTWNERIIAVKKISEPLVKAKLALVQEKNNLPDKLEIRFVGSSP